MADRSLSEDSVRLLSSWELVSLYINDRFGDDEGLKTALEREFGRSNYKDLYSVIAGGGEYRAVTPDGEPVGTLDAGFAHKKNPGNFSLGGESWSVVKCDEDHNIVVVVPGKGGTQSSRVFMAPGEEASLSPVICAAVQRIVARKRTLLPLGKKEEEVLSGIIAGYPEGIEETGLFVCANRGPGGREVTVYSFYGSRFNRVLAVLLKKALGRPRAAYDDDRVRIAGTKDLSAEKVAGAVREIAGLSPEEIAQQLPLPSCSAEKFARVLSPAASREMAMADYYHVAGFLKTLADAPVIVQKDPGPADEGEG